MYGLLIIFFLFICTRCNQIWRIEIFFYIFFVQVYKVLIMSGNLFFREILLAIQLKKKTQTKKPEKSQFLETLFSDNAIET